MHSISHLEAARWAEQYTMLLVPHFVHRSVAELAASHLDQGIETWLHLPPPPAALCSRMNNAYVRSLFHAWTLTSYSLLWRHSTAILHAEGFVNTAQQMHAVAAAHLQLEVCTSCVDAKVELQVHSTTCASTSVCHNTCPDRPCRVPDEIACLAPSISRRCAAGEGDQNAYLPGLWDA